MNVVYSSSDSYSEICGISIVSLFENNQEVESISVFIVDNDISSLNKERLSRTAKKYNREIIFVPKVDLENMAHTSIYVGQWNIGTFFRLYLGSILPRDINRVIYIDCDMIIRHSLADIYSLDLGTCSVAGVDDCRSDLYRADIDCKPGTTYINNGFMVIDLDKWRVSGFEEKCTQFISARKGDCTYMDQAPLNSILGQADQIYELPAKYNAQRIFFDFTYKQLLALRKPEHHLSESDYNEAITDPIIVHFTPTFLTGTRPWQDKDRHKFTPEYRHYKVISEWKDEPYRKDDRSKKKKLMTLLCRACPKFVMIPVMSYLHSKWYPKKRLKVKEHLLGATEGKL